MVKKMNERLWNLRRKKIGKSELAFFLKNKFSNKFLIPVL